MNDKRTIVCALFVLAILFAGLAILTHQPDTLLIIRIPAWLRAAGAVAGLAAIVLWLRAARSAWWPAVAPVSAWLDEEGD